MQLQSDQSLKGYTLVELLVSVTIIGLVFGVGYVAFRSFSQRQILDGAARDLRGQLRLAQEQALAGKKTVDCTGTLTGYQLNITSGVSYDLEVYCTNGSFPVKSVDLPTGLSLQTDSPVNPILFKVLGEGTNLPVSSINITITGFGLTQSVVVNKTGNIE